MKKGKWICFPGDYEIMLAEKVMARRYLRDFPIGPFWRVDSPWHNIKFYAEFTLSAEDTLYFSWEGRISVYFYELDKYLYGFDGTVTLPAGRYKMEIWLYNPEGLPCLKIDGNEFCSDENVQVSYNQFQLRNSFVCDCGEMTPNTFCLPKREIVALSQTPCEGGTVYDYGKIRMCFASFSGCRELPFRCYFGETLSEVMSDDYCEQISFFTPAEGKYDIPVSKAFRYLRVVTDSPYSMSVQEEYNPSAQSVAFRSENERFMQIIEVAKHTFSVCDREFFLDGAKRDRWLWGGDAYQAFKLEYFVSCDYAKIRRNIIALCGKSPVVTYINHIMDYTLYTIMSVWEYYTFSGDVEFVKFIYPILEEHMRFVLGRTNEDGFLYKQPNDWVFVDWGDLDTDGEVCFEQILLFLALKSLYKLGDVIGRDAEQYKLRAKALRAKIDEVFWSEERGAYLHSRKEGKTGASVTAYANVFAVLYRFADREKTEKIKKTLLYDESVPEITTPYMQSYKLACLFEMGEWKKAVQEIMSYWGGMLDGGATTFWEVYHRGETEETSCEMYGRKFGRSHCHIWGASVLYLIPRYIYGIRKDIACGETFELRPILSLIADSEIEVPLKRGTLRVQATKEKITVFSDEIDGKLIIGDTVYAVEKGKCLTLERRTLSDQRVYAAS